MKLFLEKAPVNCSINTISDRPNIDYHEVATIEGAWWSSGINAANGSHGPRFASRILPTVQPPWTSR